MSNKRIDFGQLGGFPLTQDTLDFMQQSYRNAIIGLAKLAGDSVIVSGMVDSGSAVTDGWIVYGGELIPFTGGNKQTKFIITEAGDNAQFEDDTVKTVYFTKTARFGSGVGDVPYADLIRLDSVKTLKDNIAALNTTLTNLQTSLANHTGDTDNPHAVTKSQIGLSNIPNAKSDQYDLNDTNTLATTAATNALFNATRQIIFAGSTGAFDPVAGSNNIGGGDGLITINHNLNINNYIVMGTLRSVGANPGADNDVFFMTRNLLADSFQIVLREVSAGVQSVVFDYVIIKKS